MICAEIVVVLCGAADKNRPTTCTSAKLFLAPIQLSIVGMCANDVIYIRSQLLLLFFVLTY